MEINSLGAELRRVGSALRCLDMATVTAHSAATATTGIASLRRERCSGRRGSASLGRPCASGPWAVGADPAPDASGSVDHRPLDGRDEPTIAAAALAVLAASPNLTMLERSLLAFIWLQPVHAFILEQRLRHSLRVPGSKPTEDAHIRHFLHHECPHQVRPVGGKKVLRAIGRLGETTDVSDLAPETIQARIAKLSCARASRQALADLMPVVRGINRRLRGYEIRAANVTSGSTVLLHRRDGAAPTPVCLLLRAEQTFVRR